MKSAHRRLNRRLKPQVGAVGAGLALALAGGAVWAQATDPPATPPGQFQSAPSTEAQPGSPLNSPASPATEQPKSPFGADPGVFPGLFATPSTTAPSAPKPGTPSDPGSATEPSGTAASEKPRSPFDTPQGRGSGFTPAAPVEAPPPLLAPQYGFGNLAPLAPFGTLPPNAAPASSVSLEPIRPGAQPTQALDPRAPPVLIVPNVSLFQGYTDNPRSTPSTLSDSLTRVGAGATISVDTVRLQGQLTGSVSFDKYARATELDTLNANLLGFGLGTVVRDHVYVDARAAITQLSRAGSVGFADQSVIPRSQQTQATTASLSPILRQSLGRYLDAELRYSYGVAMFQNGGLGGTSSTPSASATVPSTSPSDITRNDVTLSLATGRAFSVFGSKLTLNAGKVDSQSSAKSTQFRAFDDLEYVFSRAFAATARFGYENLDYPLQPSASTKGVLWLIGGRYTPAPGTSMIVNAGSQYGFFGFDAALRYELTPTTTILASLQRNLASSQEQLLNNLNSSQVDAYGNVVNQGSGLPSALLNPSFSYASDTIYRHKEARIGVQTILDRNTYAAFGVIEQRTPVGAQTGVTGVAQTLSGESTSIGANLSWNRSLTPDLGSSATIGYAIETGADSKTLTASWQLSYALAEGLTSALRYQFINIDGSITGASYRRNQVEIGLIRSF